MLLVGKTGIKYETIEPAIGKGGEGSVYRISGMPKNVLKVFIDKNRTESRHKKLLAMIASSMPQNALQQVTWPIDVVYQNGQFVGYVMPMVNNNEDLNVMYSDKYNCTLSEKITIAMNLCSAINSVHNAEQVCGDLNPKNISVDPQHALVTLVDTDSYHITEKNGNRIYRCEVGLPEYLPREIQEKMKNGQDLRNAPLPTFTKYTDLFALAVHIFALLMNGCHPFACAVNNNVNIAPLTTSQASITAPQPIDNICTGFFPFFTKKSGITTPKYAPEFDALPRNIKDLFIKAFVDGHSNPQVRPDTVEWYNALSVMQKKLKVCGNNARHMYSNHLNACPWCDVENKMRIISTPQLKQTSINTNQYYASNKNNTQQGTVKTTPNTNNISPNSSSKTGIGKWIGIGIAIIIFISLMRSCTNSTSNSNYSDSTSNQSANSSTVSNTDNFTGIDNSTDEENASSETVPSYSVVNVDSIESKSLTVNALNPNVSSVGNADILSFTGNITNEDQEDIYTFTAPYDGRYRVDLTNLMSNTNVELYIYDDSGERIASDSYCQNEEGLTVKDLTAGKVYTVKVKQDNGYSNYSLSIGLQKATVDITGITEFTDSVEYTDQRNVYSFTVPIDGRYRFELSGMQNGTAVELYMFNSLDETVASDSYCQNGEGITVKDLKAGEVYEIQIRQDELYSSYKVNIGYQKETVDISEFTLVSDSIEYTDQRNVYSFTVPIDGRYRFELSGMQSGTAVELYMFNSLDETVGSDSYCQNGEGITVKDLKAGEVYEIQIRQDEQFSPYTIAIGKQKETIEVKVDDIINDNIEYTDQRNVYFLNVKMAGDVTISLSGMQSGMAVELYAFDELGETVDSDSYCQNGESITIKNCSVGDCYEIQVRQDTEYGEYSMTIEQ